MSEHSSERSSPESRPVAAVLVAGGSGLRMGSAGGGVRKQYIDLDGVPVLARAVQPFVSHPAIGAIVVVLPPGDLASPPEWLSRLPVMLVGGGRERSDSVRNGLAVLPGETDMVLIHDAARPFVTREVIDRVIDAAPGGGAVPAVPVTDTLKEVGEAGYIVGTVDRSRLWHAQTPQGFSLSVLLAAHRRAVEEGWSVTDDAALCERIGVAVRLVEGDPANIKVTRPFDLEIARILARRFPAAGGVFP